jgi:predicted transcriptional regulator
MSVMTIRLPDATHERLRALARARGVSLNKVVEDLATRALTEHDLEARFRARAARGDRAAALALLDRLDGAETGQGASQ